jgi:hypothetical protein
MAIRRTTLKKRPVEVRLYVFDFSSFPEVLAGETLSAPSVPAVSGLTIGSPAVTSVIRDGIAAGKAVEVTIAGGTDGTSYDVEASASTSGGSSWPSRGTLVVG